ncbi:MAG: anti-sigma factor family protein [Pyrinomonadaceae bacterium]
MSCQDTQNLMPAFVDGELDLVRNLNAEQHLQDCPTCMHAYQNQQVLRSALGDGSLYFKAPPSLRKRVRSAARKISKNESAHNMLSWHWRLWLGAGASLALIAVIVFNLILIRPASSVEDLLTREIVSSHVRAMMANHLTDVPSSDQHTVKPWFDGKLDFAPPVIDLTKHGFLLIGGRLDYIDDRSVAALVYQRRQHLINLFIWPSVSNAEIGKKMRMRQGYNLIYWYRSGMTYWAVSDINNIELQEFVQATQNST